MITETALQSALKTRMVMQGKIDHIILAQDIYMPGDRITVSVSAFLALFGHADWSHASLVATDPQNALGYHGYFDDWKSQGLIS